MKKKAPLSNAEPSLPDEVGAARGLEQLACNAAALGRAWVGSPAPVKALVWSLTWVVVGTIMWLASFTTVLPSTEEMRAVLRTMSWWGP